MSWYWWYFTDKITTNRLWYVTDQYWQDNTATITSPTHSTRNTNPNWFLAHISTVHLRHLAFRTSSNFCLPIMLKTVLMSIFSFHLGHNIPTCHTSQHVSYLLFVELYITKSKSASRFWTGYRLLSGWRYPRIFWRSLVHPNDPHDRLTYSLSVKSRFDSDPYLSDPF